MSKLEDLAEALTRDPRDGSWVMNPKGAFLKGYDEGFNRAIEEVLRLDCFQSLLDDYTRDLVLKNIKSLEEGHE